MTFTELMCLLRQRLLQIRDEDNRKEAHELFIAFSVLREVSYEVGNEELTGLIVDLVDSARDVAMGIRGKSHIPSVETIKLICSAKNGSAVPGG